MEDKDNKLNQPVDTEKDKGQEGKDASKKAPEFTPEQQEWLNNLINRKTAEHKQELEDQKASEDERINKAIAEHDRRAKMTADEKAEDDRKKLKQENDRLKAELDRNARIAHAQTVANKYHVPMSMVKNLVGASDEETDNNMLSFVNEFSKAVQTGVDQRLAGNKQPQTGTQVNTDKAKKLSDLSLEEQTRLFHEDPSLYHQLAAKGQLNLERKYLSMADNQFKLANAIIPEVFANYVLNQSMKTNRLVQSGILTNDPSLGSQLLAPGDFIHMPYINDIAEGPDAQTWTDTQDISVNGLTTGEQRAFKFRQAQAFGWTDVSQQVSGAPAQSTVANRFGAYWNNQDQKLLFAELKGAFANSDIATAKMYEDSSVFSARGFLAAIAKMGDLQDNTLNKIVVHSSTYAEMKAQQLIETVQPAGAVTPISVYNGMRIVQDDDPNLINADGSTTSYVFANGAVGYSVASPQNAVEIQREARTNGGQTNVINRRVVTTHILGTSVAKTFTPAGQTVTMDELAKGTTWESIVDPRHIQVIAYKAKLDKEFAPVVPTKSDPVGK